MKGIRKNLKTFFIENGFRKTGSCYFKNIRNDEYLVFQIYKEKNYRYIDNDETDVPHIIAIDFPAYDVEMCVTRLNDEKDVIYTNFDSCLSAVSGIPKKNWVKTSPERENEIINEIKGAIKKACLEPLFENKGSLYDYIMSIFKIQKIYVNDSNILQIIKFAIDEKRYAEAFLWFKYYFIDKAFEQDFSKISFSADELMFVDNMEFLQETDKKLQQSIENYMYLDVKDYIKTLYLTVKTALDII